MAAFRKPILSVGQEIFAVANDYADPSSEFKKLNKQMLDEVLLGFLLALRAFTNVRAPLRSVISVTGASEEGGTASCPL